MDRQNPYPKTVRLRSEREFQELFRLGKRLRGSGVNVLFYQPQGPSETRIGVVVGKKFGPAPRRNRMKRYAREVLRHRIRQIPAGVHLVLEVLTKANHIPDEEIHNAMKEVISSFIQAKSR